MTTLIASARNWGNQRVQGWDRFWFTPNEPHTLSLIRILAGSMLFYTHLVWAFDLLEFLGPNAWLPKDLAREFHRGGYGWSYLWYVDSPAILWTLHVTALVVFAMFTVGLFTRVTSVLAFLITVAYCHRLTGAFFGLDQVNAMLAMYLMLGPCGAAYSLDRWLALRRGRATAAPDAAISANVAVRLIQLHMCIIYLFGGISKMRGRMWWDGSATWYAIANSEYQSFDITWLVDYPWFLALLTHITVVWETYYCVLVWPRATRTITLMLAVCVHSGIAMFLGMITFGLAMLIGNLAFVSPAVVQSVVSFRRRGRAGEPASDPPSDNRQRPPARRRKPR